MSKAPAATTTQRTNGLKQNKPDNNDSPGTLRAKIHVYILINVAVTQGRTAGQYSVAFVVCIIPQNGMEWDRICYSWVHDFLDLRK